MSDVPDEILREILKRLPVEQLLTFRSVCHSWKGLIDSPEFIKKHLDYFWNNNSNSNLKIIITSGYLYSADFDLLSEECNRSTFQQVSHPLKSPNCRTEILGSCDGMLVLSNGEQSHILWNPTTKRLHDIPVAEIEFPDYLITNLNHIVYGFGYDFLTDDYKLVRIVEFNALDFTQSDYEVQVYSLKSNSWMRIADFPWKFSLRKGNGLLVKDALHWVVCKPFNRDNFFDSFGCLIGAIDLGTYEYSLVPLPDMFIEEIFMNVGVLGGCLSLVLDNYGIHVDIWVMGEYGVEESWSVLFRLTQSDIAYKNVDFVKPIAFSDCGTKVILRFDTWLMWYDLEKKSIDLPMVEIPFEASFKLTTCFKSLVLQNNGTFDSY